MKNYCSYCCWSMCERWPNITSIIVDFLCSAWMSSLLLLLFDEMWFRYWCCFDFLPAATSFQPSYNAYLIATLNQFLPVFKHFFQDDCAAKNNVGLFGGKQLLNSELQSYAKITWYIKIYLSIDSCFLWTPYANGLCK